MGRRGADGPAEGLEQESRQREKLWFAGLFSGAGLLLILLI